MSDFVDDIDHLRLTEEMKKTLKKSRKGKRVTLSSRRKRVDDFFIPNVTATVLQALHSMPGSAWIVYLVLRRRCFVEHKVTEGKTVSLSSTSLQLFGITRWQKYRALEALEAGGLIRVDRHNGKNPKVELIPLSLCVKE
jgi:hypothetical protein